MLVRTKRPAVVALLAMAVIAGCSGAEPTATPTDSGASATPSEELAMEIEATEEPLEAGRYTRTGFTPPITIELDGSWHAVQLADGFFDVQQNPGSPDVIAVQFARPTGVFGADAGVEPSSAADAVELLRQNSDLEVVESSGSRIGGLDGSQVTVESSAQGHARVMRVPPGALGIDPGRRLWIAFFDTSDGLLAIMVGGSTARWEEALTAAEPVLESVQIQEEERDGA